ncbi:hypothetical protein PAESOLCIP111_04264 [Paenibacillus solanacearum]|uniref:DUF2249 domain-containing protein n=1 Tax=Paenibacillus solanacearum TaxID=2048548 RepID=A0A916K707_9BACL|nr:DUF2249 domain-containing protein [Paenibacillus solanacearum]CAG7641744.1 hypothetical protein PAESOLCIP111_04264 [Paenibacillus solanacearum]
MDRKAAKIVELDVRPYLRKKLEPFQLIMDVVNRLEKNDIFVLHATFKPTPLFGVLKMKGLAGKAEQQDKEHWISTFVNKQNKHWLDEEGLAAEQSADPETLPGRMPAAGNDSRTIVLDNRGLEPPQPMMRTLAALERSLPGDEIVIHNDRVPVFLIEELNRLGCLYSTEEQPDGTAKVKIQKR